MFSSTMLFIIYTIFASILAIFIIYRNFRFFLWKETQGEIVKSNPKRVESIVRYQTYEPDIEYRYKVGDKEYTSSRVFITEFQADLKTIENILKEFKVNRTVKVYYNPRNPSESILKRDLHAGMVVQIIALFGIMLPFLFQAFVETSVINLDITDFTQTVKTILHKILD